MSTELPTRIHFHAGPHKTATTYMQARLRANRKQLADRGICFVDLWRGGRDGAAYRAALRAGLDGGRVRRAQLREARDLLQNLTRQRMARVDCVDPLLVFSCEVALGNYGLMRGLYPHARAGLKHVIRVFPDAQVTFFVCTRSFDRFLESGYVQRVLGRHETRTFEEYLASVDIASLSWIPTIKAAESLVGWGNVVIWPYEDFRAREGAIWQRLLDLDDWEKALPEPAANSNPSLSQKGMEYKLRMNQHVAAIEDPDDQQAFRTLVNKPFLRNFMKQNFGTGSGLAAPKLLDDVQRERLVAQYNLELTRLRSAGRLLI